MTPTTTKNADQQPARCPSRQVIRQQERHQVKNMKRHMNEVVHVTTRLNEHEIKEALRRYIAQELGGSAAPDGVVRINMHKASGNDPREYDYVDATVEYTK